MSDPAPHHPVQLIDALKLFNEFQAQARARGEAALRMVLIISGGMLTLSVGAVLGSSPQRIPGHLLPVLQWGWGLLFFSIAASLLLVASMIGATFHMGVRWRNALEGEMEGTAFIATWTWLRIANAVIAVTILLSCLGGIALMANVALGVAGSLPATTN